VPIFIVCGVSGCGKSTVGRVLAEKLGCPFWEGDNFHPPENIQKMKSGRALDDRDRTLWLEKICEAVNASADTHSVLACSALTTYVQEFLLQKLDRRVIWIKLDISKDTAHRRMSHRDHFMPTSLLDSQFDAWCPPQAGLEVSAENPVDQMIDQILAFVKTKSISPDS